VPGVPILLLLRLCRAVTLSVHLVHRGVLIQRKRVSCENYFLKTPLLPPLKKSPSDWYALPRFAYDPPSPARSPNSLAIARFCVWYSIALPKSSSDWYAFPRFPYALPSPARSPLPPQKIPLPGLHGKRPGPCVTVPHPSHANRDKVAGGRQWGELCVLMTLPRRPVTRSVT
jgi:hypothetical protein